MVALMGEGAKAQPGAATRPGAHWSEGRVTEAPTYIPDLPPAADMAQGGLGPSAEGGTPQSPPCRSF